MTELMFGRRDPDARGYFGAYGGRFVPETLVEPVEQLERSYREARADSTFVAELGDLLTHYVGRETPLYEARRLSADSGGARIFLKREDLAHTGAHKINNALGQGVAGAANGQAPRGSRDRRRSARGCDRHRVCAPGSRVRCVHGHRGHAPASS